MVDVQNDMRPATFACCPICYTALLAFVAPKCERSSFPLTIFYRASKPETFGGLAALPVSIERANLSSHGTADFPPMLLRKNAPRFLTVAALSNTVKLNPEFSYSLPYNCFTNPIFVGYLKHGKLLIFGLQLLFS